MDYIRIIKSYGFILLSFALVFFVSTRYNIYVQSFIGSSAEDGKKLLFFATVVVLFVMGVFVYYLAKSTFFPSFVLAILFGFAAKGFLQPLLAEHDIVNMLVTIGAVFILFGGGLETPFQSFTRLLHYIFSLAFFGTLLTAVSLSFVVGALAQLFHIELSMPVMVLIGAALASTDPAAIIPSLNRLTFHKSDVKHIAISESALNDVVGVILTVAFLTLFKEGIVPYSLGDAYRNLLTLETGFMLFKLIAIGTIVGLVGYGILLAWHTLKKRINAEEEIDAAFFMAMPLLVYTASQVFMGSGFLAAFLAPLLFQLENHIKHVEDYFNNTVESFMKPMIFIFLGALINIDQLITVAPLGIGAALIFMFVIRPLVVFLTAGPITLITNSGLGIRELLFLSFVRETGVIPAVLLVTLAGSGLPGGAMIVPIGMWIILLTLIIQPPLTPFVAKFLNIAEQKNIIPRVKLGGGTELTAVLVSRGDSFQRRLPNVAHWATQHNIFHIAILHSPEDHYSEKYVTKFRTIADVLFQTINMERTKKKEKPIEFEFVAEKGLLEENINHYVNAHTNISIVFAGKKMLDFRPHQIKELSVPLFFID